MVQTRSNLGAPVFLFKEVNLVGLRFSLAYEARRSTRWEISDFPRGG